MENELQKKSSGNSGDGLTPAGQKAYIETLAQTLSTSTKPHGPARTDDVIRKSEVCISIQAFYGLEGKFGVNVKVVLVESASLKAEIRKLRIENNDLMRKVRTADINSQYMRVSNIFRDDC